MTIVEFLEARIAEEEAVAMRAGTRRDPRDADQFSWPITVTGVSRYSGAEERAFLWLQLGTSQWEGAIEPELAEHMSRWDPARVLSECAAKRALIDGTEYRMTWDDRDEFVLIPMARMWADHPDFNPAWKVS